MFPFIFAGVLFNKIRNEKCNNFYMYTRAGSFYPQRFFIKKSKWKNYLRNSGSMIEYYQMYLAYYSMSKYEKENYIISNFFAMVYDRTK